MTWGRAAADFNGDGATEPPAGASFGSSGISLVENLPTGSQPEVIDSDGQMYVASVADLDGNGTLDFVGPRRWQNRVVAYYNLRGGGIVFANGFE